MIVGAQSPFRAMMDGRTPTVQEKIAAARAKREERMKVVEKIMSKPSRKDVSRPRG